MQYISLAIEKHYKLKMYITYQKLDLGHNQMEPDTTRSPGYK